MIRPKRPRARGRPRFIVMFFPTYASATTNSSTSGLFVFSVRNYGCRHFLTSLRYAFLNVDRPGFINLFTDHRSNKVKLLRACAKHAQFAIASLSATRRGFFALDMAITSAWLSCRRRDHNRFVLVNTHQTSGRSYLRATPECAF